MIASLLPTSYRRSRSLLSDNRREMECCREVITKRLVQTTIRSIANYCKKPSRPRSCWHVDEKVLEKYGLSHLLVYNAGSAQTVSPAISQSDKASSTDSPDRRYLSRLLIG